MSLSPYFLRRISNIAYEIYGRITHNKIIADSHLTADFYRSATRLSIRHKRRLIAHLSINERNSFELKAFFVSRSNSGEGELAVIGIKTCSFQ